MLNVNNFSLILNKMVTNHFIVVHLKRIGTKKSEFFAITSFKKYKSRPKTSKHLTLNCPHSCKYVTTKTHIHTHSHIHPDVHYKSTTFDKIYTEAQTQQALLHDDVVVQNKGRNLFGAHTQRNAKKCPRTKSHSPLDNAYRLSQHLELILASFFQIAKLSKIFSI